MNQRVRSSIADVNPRLQAFLFSVHDWLAFFTDDDYLWPDYGASLVTIIKEKIVDTSPASQWWIDEILGRDLTTKTLLYRYYVLDDVLSQEINLDINFPPFYQLMASSLLQEVVFVNLSSDAIWPGINPTVHPINSLRQQRPVIKDYLYTISTHDIIHQDQLNIAHGVFSSLSLLYGLYLVQVMMVYEATVTQSRVLSQMIVTVQDTLVQLKGLLCHGSYDWR